MIPNLTIDSSRCQVAVTDGLVSIWSESGDQIDLSGCKTVEQFLSLCEMLEVDPWEEFTPVAGDPRPRVAQFFNPHAGWLFTRVWGNEEWPEVVASGAFKFRKLRGT